MTAAAPTDGRFDPDWSFGDVVRRGPGDDRLEVQEGSDLLDGGQGDDSIAAGSDDDLVIGGPGRDVLIGAGTTERRTKS